MSNPNHDRVQVTFDIDPSQLSRWTEDESARVLDLAESIAARLIDEAGYAGPGGDPIAPVAGTFRVMVASRTHTEGVAL